MPGHPDRAPAQYRFSFNGYPQEVTESFTIESDEIAVERAVEYALRPGAEPVISISISREGEGAVVWFDFDGHSQGINWAAPQKYPVDYPEYARTYYGPIGPVDVQVRRARMLRQRLGLAEVSG
jgi:hypothetical protein